MTEPTLVGRSSSHFTRTTRIFAIELGVTLKFGVLRRGEDAVDFAGRGIHELGVSGAERPDTRGIHVGTTRRKGLARIPERRLAPV